MNLHEYQAKALFKAYGMPVPKNIVANTSEEARFAAEKLGTEKCVVKAQVRAGGRVKAGGVKLVDTPREAEDYAKSMLGTRLVTVETDAAGQPVNAVLVEETCDIDIEMYLSVAVDRNSERVVVKASTEGGMDIDQVAHDTPEEILKLELNPQVGIMPEQCRELASGLGFSAEQTLQFTQLLTGLCRLFIDKDLSLVEINPLVITKAGDLICLDGKIIIDGEALNRHSDLEALCDSSQSYVRKQRSVGS